MLKKYTTLYLKTLEPLIDKTSIYLNNHLFSKSSSSQNFAVRYFVITSKITNFFLFGLLGNFIYLLFFIYVFVNNGNNFTLIYYATLNQGFSSFFINCFLYLDGSFFFLLSFLALLFELVFINTVLVSIPEIRKKILLNYGEKERL